MPLGRRPHVDDLHAIGAGGDELEVLFNLFSPSEAPVVAHAKAEVRFRGRNLRRGLPRANREHEQGDAKNAEAPASSRQSRRNDRHDGPKRRQVVMIAEPRGQSLGPPSGSSSVISSSLASNAANPHC